MRVGDRVRVRRPGGTWRPGAIMAASKNRDLLAVRVDASLPPEFQPMATELVLLQEDHGRWVVVASGRLYPIELEAAA
jgi:hypothetical protein